MSAITEASGIPLRMIAADLAQMGDVGRVAATADPLFARIDIQANAARLMARATC